MKKRLILILVALLISANIQANDLIKSSSKRLGPKTAIIVVQDIAGLNNCNSNKSLCEKNIAQYNKLITKKSLMKLKVSSIEFFTLDEQMKHVGRTISKRPGKLYRESRSIMKDVISELHKDQSKKGKDVINSFRYIQNLVTQNYVDFDQVTVILFSNLRDSMTTKQQRKSISPITMDKKISMYIYNASGLEAKGASTVQTLNAEASSTAYFKNLLSASKVVIKTMY